MNSKSLPKLITIKFSHYNEFARWSLQHCKIDFVEYGYAPVQHVVPVMKATKGVEKKIFFSEATFYDPNKERNTQTGTPIMILEHEEEEGRGGQKEEEEEGKNHSRLLADSWAIAEYAFTRSSHNDTLSSPLRPDVIALGRILNEQVGPCVRIITYSYILSPTNKNVFLGMCTDGTQGLWPVLINLGFGSILTVMLRKGFHSNDKTIVEKHRIQLQSIVKQLEQDWIVHRTSRYLIHDEISMYDLALASLMAPLLQPPLYNVGQHKKWLDLLYDQDEGIRNEITYWRGTAVGQYCLEMYEKHRM